MRCRIIEWLNIGLANPNGGGGVGGGGGRRASGGAATVSTASESNTAQAIPDDFEEGAGAGVVIVVAEDGDKVELPVGGTNKPPISMNTVGRGSMLYRFRNQQI